MADKKIILFFLALISRSYGSDVRGFEYFRAPDVVGAYSAEWNPLGVTLNGFNFGVGFYLNTGDETRPIDFWIEKNSNHLIEIDSISSVNIVINEVFETKSATQKRADVVLLIHCARHLFSTRVAGSGQTGIALYFDSHSDLENVVSRLKNAGLAKSTVDLLLKLGEACSDTVILRTKKWITAWYEIDRLGGIEKITVCGSLEPFKVISVLHESVFDAGTVDPKLLRRNIFFDINIMR